MAKEVAAFIKLQIKGGAANPSPPVGPALGSKGVNIMDFCKQFNAFTHRFSTHSILTANRFLTFPVDIVVKRTNIKFSLFR